MSSGWHAFATITRASLRRLAREGLVVRSLVAPTALTLGGMIASVAFAALTQPPPRVVLQREVATEALATALRNEQWRVDVVDDVESEVRDARAWVGLAPGRLYTQGAHPRSLAAESAIRKHLHTPWRYDPSERRSLTITREDALKWRMVRAFGVLYAMYGVVLGVGSVVRDRDEGLLEPELALGVPHWVHPLARWAAATTMLSLFFAITVGMFHAAMGLTDPMDIVRHGAAAASAAVAIGIACSSWIDRRRTFTSSLTIGIGLTSMLSTFSTRAVWRDWIPVASMASPTATGAASMTMSVVIALLATAWVTRRELRS